MCVHVHRCVYTCWHVCKQVCLCCVYVCVCGSVCASVCMFVHVCVLRCVCVYVHVFLCVFVHMCTCVHVYMFVNRCVRAVYTGVCEVTTVLDSSYFTYTTLRATSVPLVMATLSYDTPVLSMYMCIWLYTNVCYVSGCTYSSVYLCRLGKFIYSGEVLANGYYTMHPVYIIQDKK